jgi:hypothetical protein
VQYVLDEKGLGEMKDQLLTAIFANLGVAEAQKFIQKSTSTPPTSICHYKYCISLEEAQQEVDKQPNTRLQSIYEKAVEEHGSDSSCEDIWLSYIQVSKSLHQVLEN